MRVSIITICFNSCQTITDTIKSVAGQSYKNIEYIVVDGDSTDGTKEIISHYSSDITKHISEKDNGLYDALNKGIDSATGDVIGFLHADDIYAHGKVIQNVMNLFEKENTDSVYGDLVYVNSQNTEKVVRYWRAGQFSIGKLKLGWFPPHPTFFVKRDVYKRHGSFDTGFKIAADYEIMLRFLLDKRISISYLPEVLIKMRLGGASNRNLQNLFKKSSEDFMALKNHAVNFPFFVLFLKNISKIPQFITKR